MNSTRKQKLARRRGINPYRRLDVELVDAEKSLVRYTCRTCKHSWESELRFSVPPKRLLSPGACLRMVEYWKSTGVTGRCSNCTKVARDSLAPLE